MPPPLKVTLLPPSITIFGPLSLKIFAVSVIVIVIGAAPQSKVMIPPCATAATKAAPVQLAGVPLPTTWVGFELSSAWASAGTAQAPFGLPAGGPSFGFVFGLPPAPALVPEVAPFAPFAPFVPPGPEAPEPPPTPLELWEDPTGGSRQENRQDCALPTERSSSDHYVASASQDTRPGSRSAFRRAVRHRFVGDCKDK